MARQGLLIVISGPSGAGKGTVCRALLEQNRELVLSVSKTTRPPRAGERDGVNYFFVTREEFLAAASAGEFLEYALVYGEYYGTPKDEVAKKLAAGLDVILEIDTQGARQVRDSGAAGIFIFLLPPSAAELARRITRRGTESAESLQRRLAAAVNEVAEAAWYDYVVVNEDVNEARDDVLAVIRAEKLRVRRNSDLISAIIKEAKA